MKRHISLFVFFCLPGAFLAGCSDADRSSLMGEEEVPVELSALEGDVSSRAAVSAGSKPQVEFEAAMVFSRTGGLHHSGGCRRRGCLERNCRDQR